MTRSGAYGYWPLGRLDQVTASTRQLVRRLVTAASFRIFKGLLTLELKGRGVYCVAMEHATSTGQRPRVSLELANAGLLVRQDSPGTVLSPDNQDPSPVQALQIAFVSHKNESEHPIPTRSLATSADLHPTTAPTSTPRHLFLTISDERHTHLQRVASCRQAATGGGR